MWGDEPPAGARATLHGYVAALRRALEPGRGPREDPTVLVTSGDAYLLQVDYEISDAAVLAAAVAEARSALGEVDPLRPAVAPPALARAIADRLRAALALWRGEPYAELPDDPDAAAAPRLAELRDAARELEVVALLALGEEAVAATTSMTAEQPLHERWWALHALALTRAGRQADALAALQQPHATLDEELGVEPAPFVRDLQTAILRVRRRGRASGDERLAGDPMPRARSRASV